MGETKKGRRSHKKKDLRGRPKTDPTPVGRPPKKRRTAEEMEEDRLEAARAAKKVAQERRALWKSAISTHSQSKGHKFTLVHTALMLVLMCSVCLARDSDALPYCATRRHKKLSTPMNYCLANLELTLMLVKMIS